MGIFAPGGKIGSTNDQGPGGLGPGGADLVDVPFECLWQTNGSAGAAGIHNAAAADFGQNRTTGLSGHTYLSGTTWTGLLGSAVN